MRKRNLSSYDVSGPSMTVICPIFDLRKYEMSEALDLHSMSKPEIYLRLLEALNSRIKFCFR